MKHCIVCLVLNLPDHFLGALLLARAKRDDFQFSRGEADVLRVPEYVLEGVDLAAKDEDDWRRRVRLGEDLCDVELVLRHEPGRQFNKKYFIFRALYLALKSAYIQKILEIRIKLGFKTIKKVSY